MQDTLKYLIKQKKKNKHKINRCWEGYREGRDRERFVKGYKITARQED